MKKSITTAPYTRPLLAPLTLAVLFGVAAIAADAQAARKAQAAPSKPAAAAPAADDVGLNFVGADIESVIKAVGHYTSTTFVIDPRVKGTLTLVSEKPLSKSQAMSLLSTQLRLQGYAVVMADGFAKVVPEADAKVQPGPTTVGTAATLKGDQIATQIFRLNYESPTNMVTVLRPLVSPNNTINANAGNNTLVITDYADNLQRLARIISALDSPANADIDVLPVRYAIAADLANMVTRLMDNGPADAGRISLLADSRTNSLVLRAPSVARANLAKSLIFKLDQPTAQLGNVHVVYLKNAEAVKLAQTLRAVVSLDSSALPSSSTSSSTPSVSSGPNAPTSSTSSSAPATLSSGGAAGFIQADASTNTLIITASEAVYRNLRAVIDQLDARRAQVYIESLIVEVTSEKAAELGVQWAALSGDGTSNYRVGALSASALAGANGITALAAGGGTALPGPGLTLGIFRQINGQLGLGALAHALASDANTNILSTPNVTVVDNEEVKLVVGQNVPFITGQYTTGASSGASGVNPFQTVERKDVGLQLTIRPQISEGGTVKMKIYQESSSVAPTVNAAGIITNKRSIDTTALADDGQILVLGGLIEDSTTDGVEKVPGLGDMPLIGGLFKYQTRGRKKTNLMVFLRPTIIRGAGENALLLNDRYDYIRGAELAAKPEPSSVLPDVGGPVLAPLDKNGKPLGGSLLQAIPKNATPTPAPASTPIVN